MKAQEKDDIELFMERISHYVNAEYKFDKAKKHFFNFTVFAVGYIATELLSYYKLSSNDENESSFVKKTVDITSSAFKVIFAAFAVIYLCLAGICYYHMWKNIAEIVNINHEMELLKTQNSSEYQNNNDNAKLVGEPIQQVHDELYS